MKFRRIFAALQLQPPLLLLLVNNEGVRIPLIIPISLIPMTLTMSDVLSIVKNLLLLAKHFLVKGKTESQLEKVKQIYEEMIKIVETTGVERFFILKAENGGGVVKPGVHLYGSVIYEMYRTPVQSHIRDYQRILLDSEYIRILVEAMQNPSVDIQPEKLPPCILKQIYAAEDIHFCRIFYLGSTKKAVYYCSLATTDPQEFFQDPKDQLAISLAINKIKILLK